MVWGGEKERKMKITLEYINGEVRERCGNCGQYYIYEEEIRLSPLFKDYYKNIKNVFERHMKRIESKTGKLPDSKLEIELQLKEKGK